MMIICSTCGKELSLSSAEILEDQKICKECYGDNDDDLLEEIFGNELIVLSKKKPKEIVH